PAACLIGTRARPFFLPAPPPPGASPLSLHDALPISVPRPPAPAVAHRPGGARCAVPQPVLLHRRGDGAGGRGRRRADHQRRPVEIGRAPSELQSRENLVCRLLLEKKKTHTGGPPSDT